MDQKNTQEASPVNPEHRMRQVRRTVSESLADGTSKLFSTMVAKKTGFLNELSSKIENTFSSKTDTVIKNNGSNRSVIPPLSNPDAINSSPPRPPPPKRAPSVEHSRDGNLVQRTASLPAYTRTNSKSESEHNMSSRSRGPPSNRRRTTSDERFSVNGMNVSFDEPIYNKRGINSTLPVTEIAVSDTIPSGARVPRTRHASGSSSSPSTLQPISARKPRRDEKRSDNSADTRKVGGTEKLHRNVDRFSRGSDKTKSLCREGIKQSYSLDRTNIYADDMARKSEKIIQGKRISDDSGIFVPATKKDPRNDSNTESMKTADEQNNQVAPKCSTKRRSNTVDEILFDDYIKPDVDVNVSAEEAVENLISFETELKVDQEINSSSSSSEGNDKVIGSANVDASDLEFSGVVVHRSASVGSDKSWSSVYSVDSQPDDTTIESMDFMKVFVDKIFHNSEDISQTEKAKFGELCQHFPGRLWFSRYVSSQRVHNKKVDESVFFRLMQYFAVCLFECNEADDFSPAKTLMNMCFTFYHEAPNHQGQPNKVFLYTYMRDQPIWQSLRFWNAAYFDAVQCERSRRPMPTNSDGNEVVSDDNHFQENITFGQLGTFACNMREFGLSRELCLEFLRKQSTIANLGKDQVQLLKENIERVKDI